MALFPSFVFLFFCFTMQPCYAIDTITKTHFLQYRQTLVSQKGTFKLGFFTPLGSTNRYLGIWFNKVSPIHAVWVANRNKPITDSSGVLKISEDGNLQLLSGKNQIIWSSEAQNLTVKNTVAQILDTGNLVLQQVSTNKAQKVWSSFDHPTNTFLPGMSPEVPNIPNQKKNIFRSWKTPLDPSEGSFSIGIDPSGVPQVFTWKNGTPHWRSAPWDGNNFIGVSDADSTVADGFQLKTTSATVGMVFSAGQTAQSSLLNYMLEPNGTVIEQFWDDQNKNWAVGWLAPSTSCDVYATCGAFGVCNHMNNPICRCLKGFEPKNKEEWKRGNWSSGCARKTSLKCGTQGGQQNGFMKLQRIKVPDFIEKLSAFTQDSCKTKCLNNCSCLAYAYRASLGCMAWNKYMIDIQEFSAGGIDFFVKLPLSELEKGKGHRKTAIITSTVVLGVGAIVVVICICLFRRWALKRGRKGEQVNIHSFADNVSQLQLQEPPTYTFDMLRNATNNFLQSNKLGEGGFGPVYKGVLEDGQEIAVKRLSRASGQGQEELMNEVMVISKLQHRNLVKLLGCCVEGDERMLIYEYLPNKSLDAFLFGDRLKREVLPWEKRFKIMEGICRGLLYLHRDSRLKIIHRDLKTSNILLDEELNPKISDFGMARIFGGNQDHASTKRLVGTYGYMSPEYTMGQFSEKSDVYSFGVILLEIVSGKKITTFHRSEESMTLLGYAWKLWNEKNLISLIDPVISNPCFHEEILRCIQVGLLCVQELAKDRPSTSTLISMLDSNTEHLPRPKKPPFSDGDTSSSNDQNSKSSSNNNYSLSIIEAR